MSDLSVLEFVAPPAAPETFNVLLYGRPKSGKSTAGATAPGPILWVNAEGPGALGYARKIAGERGTEIHEVEISAAKRNATQVLDAVYLHLKQGSDPVVKTVVIDTLAKVRDALVAQLVVKGSKQSLPQYGQVADKLGGFVLALRDMPINLVLLAHIDIADSEDGRIVNPLIGGALTEKIPGEVDVVAYTAQIEDENGQRRFYGQLVEGKGRQGGERSGALGGERGIRELDLSEWLATYSEALTPKPADTSDLPFDESFVEPAAEERVDATAQMEKPDA